MICWKCKKEIKISEIYRNSECPLCHADLHACKGCKFYSTQSHYECRETIDEKIVDKEKSNFCEYFSVNTNLSSDSQGGNSAEDKAKAAKDAFNALFG